MSIQESFLRYYAEHPDEYRTVLALSERIAALAELPEESSEVERLVDDYVRYARTSSLPEEVRRGPDWTAELIGTVFFEVMAAGMFPAQRRFVELCKKRLPVLREAVFVIVALEVLLAIVVMGEVLLVATHGGRLRRAWP